MTKIAIIGHSGSGKSTLAAKLGTLYATPVLHLDTLQFLPGWQNREPEDFRAKLSDFLNQNDSWVIDGVYSKYLFDERMAQAVQIIYLNFNRFSAFYRILKRYFTYRGQSRASMAEGCPEKIDWEFLKFALIHSRRPERMRKFDKVCQTYRDKTIILKTQKDINHFLKSLA